MMFRALLPLLVGGYALGCAPDFDPLDPSLGGAGAHAGAGGLASGGSGASPIGGGGQGAHGGDGGAGLETDVVICDGEPCATKGMTACCFNQTVKSGSCTPNGNCAGGEISVTCDGPEDCPGQICCGSRPFGYEWVRCESTCEGSDHFIICHLGDDSPCSAPDTCLQSINLADGYGVCR